MPESWFVSSANSRQATCAPDTRRRPAWPARSGASACPVVPTGKNSSGSVSRQMALRRASCSRRAPRARLDARIDTDVLLEAVRSWTRRWWCQARTTRRPSRRRRKARRTDRAMTRGTVAMVGSVDVTDVIAHRGASRPGAGEHGRGVPSWPSSSAPTASSSMSAAPPTACSSSTTTPACPTGGRSSTTPWHELPAVRADARRRARRVRRGVGQHRDQERPARARLRPRRPRRRRRCSPTLAERAPGAG